MAAIEQLGHVGLYCDDLRKMRDFYSGFLGLTITDEDVDDHGFVFLSARPKSEHHELVLVRAKDNQRTRFLQQVSFVVGSMEDLQTYHRKIKSAGVRINRTVTHGNACSVYFYDPEDNVVEVYFRTGYEVRQPLNAPIDLDQPIAEILAVAK